MPAKPGGSTGVFARKSIWPPHAGVVLYRSVGAQKSLNHPQVVGPVYSRQQRRHFRPGQHHGQLPLALGTPEARKIAYRLPQKLRREKNNRIERQRLGARGDISLRRQKGQKLHYVFITQSRRVLIAIEEGKKLDQIQVGIDGAAAVAVRR